MQVVIEEVDPLICIDELLELFKRGGKPKTREFFEWYYEDKGFGAPLSWVLREKGSGRVVGLNSAVFRRLRFGEHTLTAAVGGNLLVDKDARKTIGALRLVRTAMLLVKSGRADVGLVIRPNPAAERLIKGCRFQTIGAWRTCVQVFRSRRWLRDKLGLPAAAISPFVDFAATVRRTVQRHLTRDLSDFHVRKLGTGDIANLSFNSWQSAPGRFVGELSSRFLVRQFAMSPEIRHDILGVYHSDLEQPAAIIVAICYESKGKVEICYAGADRRYLSETEAILAFVQSAQKEWGIQRIDALEASDVYKEAASAGFVQVPVSKKHPPPAFMACWRPDHEFAAEYACPENWSLFQGINDVSNITPSQAIR